MGEGKKKVRRKASRREKKDWVAATYLLRRLRSDF